MLAHNSWPTHAHHLLCKRISAAIQAHNSCCATGDTEEIYKKTIFEDEPVSDDVKQRELMEILVDEKNAEIVRLYEQLKAKDEQLAKKDEQLRVKDVQIAEKDKQLDQQQQLTLQAMNDRDTLKLELEQANEKVQEQESKGFWARVFRR